MESIFKIFKGDRIIWFIFFSLCVVSLIEVFSAGSRLTYQSGNYWKPLREQAAILVAGFIIVLFFLHIQYKWFPIIAIILIPFSFVTLFIALFSGQNINDAARWASVMGVRFQPSELAKMAMVVFSAFVLSKKYGENKTDPTAFRLISTMLIAFCVLIVTENLSTAGILFIVIMLMMFIGGVSLKKMFLLIGILLIPVMLVFLFVCVAPKEANKITALHRADMWVHRIENFASDHKVVAAEKYDIANNEQVGHARIAVATSSIFGRAPGNSIQRDFLSEAASDFIYAIIIEETGLLGGIFVLFLYVCLLVRAGRIAQKCGHPFPALLVIGIALMMVFQALLNMMVAVGLFPVTGQPLPLISKGGTNTLINCIYIGMILSVSRFVKMKETNAEDAGDVPEEESTEPTAELLKENVKLK